MGKREVFVLTEPRVGEGEEGPRGELAVVLRAVVEGVVRSVVVLMVGGVAVMLAALMDLGWAQCPPESGLFATVWPVAGVGSRCLSILAAWL